MASRRNSKPYVRAQFLPLLDDIRVVGDIYCVMKRVFCAHQIVHLNKAITESSERIPVLRIVSRHLAEYRNCLAAAPLLLKK